MRNPFYQILYTAHRFSIDIAAGACALQWAVSRALGTNPEWYYQLLLFMGTLLVYWIDHLQDSNNALLVLPGMRHAVFARYKVVFYILCILLFTCLVCISIIYLPLPALITGIALAAGMGAYALFHRNVKSNIILQKELLVSLLYALSVLYAPVVEGANLLLAAMFILIVFLAALQNLFSIARIEYESDTQTGTMSILRHYGKSRLRTLQAAMLLLQLVSTFILLFILPHAKKYEALSALFLIAAVNYALPFIWDKPDNRIWYRIMGDGIFLAGFLGCC